jgi:hypothetical protein
MRRYLPAKATSSRRLSVIDSEKDLLGPDDDERLTVASTIKTPLSPPSFKVKRVDHYYSRWSRKWKYQTSGSSVIPELRPLPSDGKDDDPWQEFCFVVVRTIPKSSEPSEPTFKVTVKSPYLLKVCTEVMQQISGLSWNSVPLEVLRNLVCF